MASSGSFTTDTTLWTYVTFSWSIVSQDITNNHTTIKWNLNLHQEAGVTIKADYFKLQIDGNIIYQISNKSVAVGDFANGTIVLEHSNDGTRSFNVSMDGKSTIIAELAISGAQSFAVDPIARASDISSAGDTTLGTACHIKWTPKNKDFGYKLRFSIGNWNGTTGAIVPGTTGAYLYTGYNIPLEAANQIPNSKTGTMAVTLYTYTDSNCTTQIGSPSTANFTAVVPNSAAPRISMVLSPVNSMGEGLDTFYIRRLGKVGADFSKTTGQYGATIKSCEMIVNGSRYTDSPYQSDWLPYSGTIEVKGIVTDSRGYSTEDIQHISVIPYDSPVVVPHTGSSAIICARCDSSGRLNPSGTHLKIRAGRKYSKVISDGVQKNFCMLGYRYALSGTALPSTFTALIERNSTSDDIDVVVPGVTLGIASSYTVQLHAIDDYGAASTLTFAISTDQVTLHLREGGKGVGVGKYAEADEAFDVAWDTTFRKSFNGCYLKRITVEGGTTMRIQTMWTAFDGGATRQTIYIFGSASGTPIHGMITVNRDGVASWSGTGNVTVAAVTGGAVEITFPAVAWDVFTAFSAKFIDIA